MFRGDQPNPYDDIVNKTTDENLTSENWELILNLCDKVQEEGEQGARNVIAAALKRLAHRNPNVQLYALALVEALSKNCDIEVHREIASRSFTQGLEKIISDRNTHEKVRRKALSLIAMWTADFENNPSLGVMEECYTKLKAKNYKFEETAEPPPPQVDDEVRRREEEELQRVLEMSVLDKGGRNNWAAYSAGSSSGAGGSGSSSSLSRTPAAAGPSSSSHAAPSSAYTMHSAYPAASSGYVPARTPSPQVQTPVASTPAVTVVIPSSTSAPATSATTSTVSRVRALHTFEPTETGELAFEKGDIIKVVDRNYKDWWRGQLRGRTGIFPVNYVEPLPEPTAAEIAKEAEQEAAIFAQAANIDKLLNMLRGLDPAKDNLADNEEIQELYRTSMTLRPKIVKLIDKYSQKRAELVMMNESFVKARTVFDRMMEDSLARHTGLYEGRPAYQQQPAGRQQAQPDSRARQDYRASSYLPYEQSYNAFPQPAGYPQAGDGVYAGPPVQHPPQPYADPNAAYAQQQPQAYPQHYAAAQTPRPYGSQHVPSAADQNAYAAGQPQAQAQPQAAPQVQYQPATQGQPQPQAQPQAAQQPQYQAATQSQPQPNGHVEPASSAQPQAQAQATAQQQGPPYVYDPNTTYADPNVQAWAQYYAQGGKDLAGAVYFVSIPGVTDQAPPAGGNSPAQTHSQSQPQQQQSPSTQGAASPYQSYPAQSTTSELAGYAGPQASQVISPGPSHDPSNAQGQTAPGAYTGPGNTSPQNSHAVQYQQPSSPTTQHAPSYYQPTSPGGGSQTHSHTQQYPPNPYPGSPNGHPSPAYDGSSQPPLGSPDPQPQYGAQYTHMQGQFAGMGIGEAPPGAGVPPTAQMA